MELEDFFRSYIETEEEPVVICDLDFRIIYMNRASAVANERFGGYDLIGKSLNTFMDLETQSKINMVVEWFKESKDNNITFALRENDNNTDAYIAALRDRDGNLIGFCNKRRCRTPDDSEPYEVV
ncbi:MAG: PAS domain-containing protein [Ruminococcus sp.]|nr:PAS domain-containing protein [Ruminococcus sp.]